MGAELGVLPMNVMKVLLSALFTVLTEKRYLVAFILLIPAVFLLFVLIPVMITPYDSIRLQLMLYTKTDLTILGTLSVLYALFLVMYVYNVRRSRKLSAASGSVGSVAGVLASFVGAMGCPMCTMSLFGFLGFGTVGFVVHYRWLIFAVSLALVLISLYALASKIKNVCRACAVPAVRHH